MKILYLHLHNFSHIYSGLGVRDVYLDFYENTKVINVIIGKMGSCKTVILGHLQPFAIFGTIDARNQDGIVIPGENGRKELHIRDGNVLYKIVHTYTWKNGHHTIRSYISEDGKDLNPIGSPTNFKMLVESKLGIDQNLLTLIRLGPNVTNMIDLPSSQRKSFMANLLQDTEVYTMLYKKLNDDLRMMNAQVSVMTNRLAKVSKGNIDEIRNQYEKGNEQIRIRTEENAELQEKLNSMNVLIQSSTNGMTVTEFSKYMDELQVQIRSKQKEIEDLEKRMEENASQSPYGSISDILVAIGAGKQKMESISAQLMQLDAQCQETRLQAETILEKKLVSVSQDQIKTLENQYDQIQKKFVELSESVSSYSYQYDSTTLMRVLSHINTINLLIHEISLYNPESVQDILRHGEYSLTIAKKKTEVLLKVRSKIQKRLNNFDYLKQYKPEDVVFFPPDCPTHDCPYYKTHPITVSESLKGLPMDEETRKNRENLDLTEKEIDRYAEYPVIVSKISAMKVVWNEIAPILSNLHVLIARDFKSIFSSLQSQVWYDHDLLMRCIEKSENYEMKNKLSLQLTDLQSQLESIKASDAGKLQTEYEELQKKGEALSKQCSDLEEEYRNLQKEEDDLQKALSRLMDNERIQDQISEKKREQDQLQSEFDSKKDVMEKVKQLRGKMEPILMMIESNQKDLEVLQEVQDQNRLALTEYESTSKDLQKMQEDQEILKYIVEAVSSSKGIPLVYIQLFLRSCKEILNELIANVFGDSIEVLDFIITQDEFKIPYSINGTMVDDIVKASQGQRSIISLALSFALIRQATTKYNILLLDEMDGPLYASDRTKFFDILYKQIAEINAEQIFLVSHNNTFEGHNVNIIMTTEEHVEDNGMITVMRVCEKNVKEAES